MGWGGGGGGGRGLARSATIVTGRLTTLFPLSPSRMPSVNTCVRNVCRKKVESDGKYTRCDSCKLKQKVDAEKK